MKSPAVSICIPVYKNVAYLKRLLDSALAQTFTDFEIIVSDDSPDDAVGSWLAAHYPDPRIRYFRNPVALGTPENWNEAICKAGGEWIKLMHDDDWFLTPEALGKFCSKAVASGKKIVFSAYTNVGLESGSRQTVFRPWWRWQFVRRYPAALYARNIIGPPSVILVHSSVTDRYDPQMKWLVDIDFYITRLRKEHFAYVPVPLIAVGVSTQQVTVGCHTVPEVEIPEGLAMHAKLPGKPFHNILYFDAWWRLIRNLNFRKVEALEKFAGAAQLPEALLKIIAHQQRVSPRWLRNGYLSKLLMTRCWLINRLTSLS